MRGVQVQRETGPHDLVVADVPEPDDDAALVGGARRGRRLRRPASGRRRQRLPGGEDWRSQVLAASGVRVNVVFDPVGGERFAHSLRCMAREGRLVVVGFADGQILKMAVNRLLLRNLDLCGCTWSILAAQPGGLAARATSSSRWSTTDSCVRSFGTIYPLEDAT